MSRCPSRKRKPSTQPLGEAKKAPRKSPLICPRIQAVTPLNIYKSSVPSVFFGRYSRLFVARITTIDPKPCPVMPPALAESFKRSYGDFESYPRNLICQTTYRDAADAYYARLRGAERTLLVQDEDEIEVPFRDLLPSAQGMFLSVALNNPSDLVL